MAIARLYPCTLSSVSIHCSLFENRAPEFEIFVYLRITDLQISYGDLVYLDIGHRDISASDGH